MNYELVSVLRVETDNWKQQKQQAINNNSKVITLLPDPFFTRYKKEEYENMMNIVDYVTKRTYDEKNSLFFDKVPMIDGAEIFMNADGIISIIKNGVRIGEMRTFPQSRRLVQDVTYFNDDGTKDMVEEYTFDGSIFSNIYYYEDRVQEIDFTNNDGQVCLRFYFYEGEMNLITVVDPTTNAVLESYDNMIQFQKAQLQKIVGPEDQINISYLGMELDVLEKTKSKNTLYLEESAFDGSKVKGNLKLIMDDQIQYVQQAVVKHEDYDQMVDQGLNVSKVRYVD
ncbi:hypothetical protein PGA94_00545 [Pediococcus pentosaceus]|jgi:hypothetical protein|uniref:hypothetical protein n=1 Tax=Pediococcus pentosaceus TaxID=1255 RepID=UPI0022E732AF|nr:hypothetical protein [Pediococcus pentosaceus]MCH3989561.1 hypothetical protein [Pediococcus pentosaceus]MDB1561313.1 hypothetical protein [Pediococcus pentosaceus]